MPELFILTAICSNEAASECYSVRVAILQEQEQQKDPLIFLSQKTFQFCQLHNLEKSKQICAQDFTETVNA